MKISKLLNASSGFTEPFEFKWGAKSFGIPELKGDVLVKGKFLRVEEGIMMLISTWLATQEGPCVRCLKKLTRQLKSDPSEWLFYENQPLDYDDENEWLTIDRQHMELDPKEPIRQELLLHLENALHCDKDCAKFEEEESEGQGVKALSGLKHLLQ